MSDILWAAAGIGAGLLVGLPFILLVGTNALIISIVAGGSGGVMARKVSPGGMGWKTFLTSFWTYKRLLMAATREGALPDNVKGVPYQGLIVKAPKRVKETTVLQIKPKHVAVSDAYQPRDP